MPNFVKILFGSCLGTLLALGVLFFLGVSIISGLAAADEPEVEVKPNTILTLDLSSGVSELSGNQPVESPFAFNFEEEKPLGIHDLVRAIDHAATDDDIKGIFLNKSSAPLTFTTLRSVREALVRFRESGKFVVAYAPIFEQNMYYLASAGDEVYVGPLGLVDFRGLGAEIPFLKTMLDNIGVSMEVFYAGDYKSATEPLRRTDISPENREQTKEFLEDLFGVMLTDISNSRPISAEALRTAADEMTGWKEQEAIDAGLIDGILTRTQVDELLHNKLGLEPDESIPAIGTNKYFGARLKPLKGGGDDEIAVLIAEGGIIDGRGDLGSIGDKKYVNEIEKLTEDDDVKAVVLRVNSGGGSASASENIWYAVEQLKASGKPVVVSMGDYAASGGYYIAAGADRIYAEPTTITGSIGVFLTFPILEELMNEKIGVNFDTVNTARNATAFSPFRPLGQEERDLLNQRTQSIYQTFLNRVAEGRNIPEARVREIAGGRVYSGLRAKELGLVDEFGSLDEAIRYAAAEAGLDTEAEDYSVGHYPKIPPVWESLIKELMGESDDDNQVAERVLRSQLDRDTYEHIQLIRELSRKQGAQMRLPLVLKF